MLLFRTGITSRRGIKEESNVSKDIHTFAIDLLFKLIIDFILQRTDTGARERPRVFLKK